MRNLANGKLKFKRKYHCHTWTLFFLFCHGVMVCLSQLQHLINKFGITDVTPDEAVCELCIPWDVQAMHCISLKLFIWNSVTGIKHHCWTVDMKIVHSNTKFETLPNYTHWLRNSIIYSSSWIPCSYISYIILSLYAQC